MSLSEKCIIIKGRTDGIDTSAINGRLFLNLMASLAEYERELIRERAKAGLQSARVRGRPKGYKKKVISKLLLMHSVYQEVKKSPEEIFTALGLTRATFYRYAMILDNYTDEGVGKMAVDK